MQPLQGYRGGLRIDHSVYIIILFPIVYVLIWVLQEIFEGLRKSNELHDDDHKLSVSLDHRDLECLDAASLLHNIGLYTGKKGYHKQSYRVLVVCALSVVSLLLEEFVESKFY